MKMVWIKLRSLICSGVLASIVCFQALAAGADAETATYGDWTMRCVHREGLMPCDVIQSARQKDGQQTIMQLSFSYVREKNLYAVQFLLPLGFMIQPGVIVRIDEKTELKDWPVTRCTPQGCFVEKLVGAQDLVPFQTGKTGVISLAVRDGRILSLPISLNGFTTAMDEMTIRNKKQMGK